MVAKIEISRTLKGSFVLSERTLIGLYNHLRDSLGRPVSVSVRFVNARTISTDDLAAILADSSVASHKIELLRLTCGSFTDDNQATVTLGLAESRPVVIEIKGDRRLAIALEDSIVNELRGVRSPLVGPEQLPVGGRGNEFRPRYDFYISNIGSHGNVHLERLGGSECLTHSCDVRVTFI